MNKRLKNLPIYISDFKTMIEEDYLYIDKTEQIYNLISKGSKQFYFISRPRRFGKSLLISTLNEIFSGNKDLFKSLWISHSDYNWKEYYLINLDFSTIYNETSQELKLGLSDDLDMVAHKYDVDISKSNNPRSKLKSLIYELHKKNPQNKVVILIDEYDYPILNNLDNLKIAKANQKVLKSFFSIIKGMTKYLRAAFITGVTRFAKTSIFSGMNNLNDISLKKEGADLLGYTETELNTYFKQYIENMAKEKKSTKKEIEKEIKDWYNGYRFSEIEIKIYNPFSVLYYFNDKVLSNYWLETGTPSFLVHLLKSQFEEVERIRAIELGKESLGSFEIDNVPIVALLFQAGYLTISDYDKNTKKYTLDFPNKEIKDSFNLYLVSALANSNTPRVEAAIDKLKKSLEENNIENFCKELRILLANIPYNLYIEHERYFHSLFQVIIILLGYEAQSEILTNKGRIDLVIITDNRIFIFEFKLHDSAEKALIQIQNKTYYEKYLNQDKPITLVGVSFSYKAKQLKIDWVKQDLDFSNFD